MPEDEFKDGQERKKAETTEALRAQRKTKALLQDEAVPPRPGAVPHFPPPEP